MTHTRTYVVPQNDLESVTIIQYLKGLGYREGENLFVTKQGWGASWEELEPEIKEALEGKNPGNIYGVELKGKYVRQNIEANNIDHHAYEEDDRSKDKYGEPMPSSIEQVAEIEISHNPNCRNLNEWEMYVAYNDKAYIDGMKKYGIERGLSKERIQYLIQEIRAEERRIQGITPEQEKQADEAIKNMKVGKHIKIVFLPHSKTATITDRLYGQYENLLVLSTMPNGKTEANFFGSKVMCRALHQSALGGWMGGDTSESKTAYWGVENIPHNTVLETMQAIDKKIKSQNISYF